MILAITRENEKLIDGILTDNGYDNSRILTGVTSLKKFAIQELKNLNNYKSIIIDINSTKEKEEELIQAVVAIKSMYNIRIIILAIGYKQGNSLLAKLFNEGIYNFVTGDNYLEQKEQFKNCLSKEGYTYKDSIRFRNEVNFGKSDKIIIKKEFRKLKQFGSIAIAGTQTHIGTTTQSILIAIYLNNLGFKACYVEANANNDIDNISLTNGAIKKGNLITYRGLDMYKNNIEAMKEGYDFFIYDYGILDESNLENFLAKDVKIVVTGTKQWEYQKLFKTISIIEKVPNINYIYNFASDEDKRDSKNIKAVTPIFFFSSYTPDPFSIDVNNEIYQKILKDFITEKSNKVTVLEKKGIFNFLKRGKNE